METERMKSEYALLIRSEKTERISVRQIPYAAAYWRRPIT
jgi:hypothetical protein